MPTPSLPANSCCLALLPFSLIIAMFFPFACDWTLLIWGEYFRMSGIWMKEIWLPRM
jgi:hypothetical protein